MFSSYKIPLRKFFASVSAVTITATSFAALPAAQAEEAPPYYNFTQYTDCRDITATATSYQGLPGQYQLAYSKDKLYTTFANGRPPVLTGGLGVWSGTDGEPTLDETLLPRTVDFTPRGEANPTGKQVAAPYGVAVDEKHKTVWVTETRLNAVSVYDLETKKLLWTSYNAEDPSKNVANHPREVKIDTVSGYAFVSGSGGVSVFTLDNPRHLDTIKMTHNGEPDTAMNMEIDPENFRLYVPGMNSETLKVIDTRTFKVEKDIKLHRDNPDVALRPSDVTINAKGTKVYISSQGERDRETGQSKGNSGVTVYDLNQDEYSYSIPFGQQALATTYDKEKDLVYVTDFATGKIGIINANTRKVVSEVNAGSRGANDVLLTPKGDVYAVVKDTYAESITTDYTIDPKTGEYRESSTEPKGENGADSPINANSLVKIQTNVENKDRNIPETSSTSAEDGAEVTANKVVHEKGKLNVQGRNFKDKNGNPSKVAIKFDGGQTAIEDKPYVTANPTQDGYFSYNFDVPEQWKAGSEHRITVLTGSGNPDDPKRSLELTVKVEGPDYTCSPESAQQVTPTKSATEVNYPKGTRTDGDNNPEPKPDPKPVPRFSDVSSSDPFFADISWLGQQGITTGYGDGSFHPQEAVSREAMAAYFYRLAGSPEVSLPEVSPFSDVSESDPFYREIVWMYQQGVTTGFWDGSFRPKESVSREAMAAFFYRFAGSPEFSAPVNSPFSDLSYGDGFYREIAWLKSAGVARGWDDGSFRPKEAISREAMAAFIHRYATSHPKD